MPLVFIGDGRIIRILCHLFDRFVILCIDGLNKIAKTRAQIGKTQGYRPTGTHALTVKFRLL